VLPRLRGNARTAASPLLTARELEILTHVAKGESNRVIARSLRIGEATVKTHLLNAFTKLGVDDRTAAVTEALRRGILRLD
jgi:DNA-binding NarL/FixJ family response regulator